MSIRPPIPSARFRSHFARALRSRAPSAFTLLEVMIATLVLGLVISTSIAAMNRAFPAIDTARNITLAGQILQTEIERLRLRDWSTVNALGDGSVTIHSSFTANPAIGNRFTMTRTVSSPQTDMKQITLTASWTGYQGRAHARSYTTRYARYGMYDYFYNTK